MRTQSNFHFFLSLLFILSFVSCGKASKENKERSSQDINPSCSEIDCLSTINWKITLRGQSFPAKSKVDINGSTVVNECVSKQKYFIDRSFESEALHLENFFVPKRGDLKIDIYDMGDDCESSSTFISNDKVDFEVEKSLDGSRIIINL